MAYDYGSVTFPLFDMQNALYYGYHKLMDVAIVEFEYSNIKLNPDISLGTDYTYQTTKNTYANLEKKEDIDEYALGAFGCVERAIGYAQSILYKYTSGITLW